MTTRCHEWTAGLRSAKSYGQFRLLGKNRTAHRVAWELAKGAIPADRDVLHTCDNKQCVRVSHLYLGNDADNGRDRALRGQAASGARHRTVTRPERTPRGVNHPSHKRPELRQGVNNGMATISEETARAILEEYSPAYGELIRLSKKYKTTRTVVERLVKGYTWRHLQKVG